MTTLVLLACIAVAWWLGYITAVLDARRYLNKHLADLFR